MLKKKGILQLNAPQHGSISEFSFKLNVRVSYLSGFGNLKNIRPLTFAVGFSVKKFYYKNSRKFFFFVFDYRRLWWK